VNGHLRNLRNTGKYHLAVFTKNHIRELLSKGEVIGPSHLIKAREADVYSRSSVRIFANCDPDSRLWLYGVDKNGVLRLMRCLSYARPTEHFENIRINVNNGIPWVVVFKEERKSNEDFPPIRQDSMMIFGALSEPKFNDLSHIEHFIAQPNESCGELFQRVKDTDGFQDFDYKVFLRTPSSRLELKGEEKSLKECGICPGAFLEFQKQDTRNDAASNLAPQSSGNPPADIIPAGDAQRNSHDFAQN